MSNSMPSVAGSVVHLLQHWGDKVPPESLRIKPRIGSAARALLALLLTAASALAVFLIVILWTFETPGWWFSLLFTLTFVGLVFGLWVGFVGALQSGVVREQATIRWAEIVETVRPSSGTVVARDVATREDGSVHRFTLTVMTEHRATLEGVWEPSSTRSLLQSQVPGVGALVRVWRNEHGPDSDPLVIEALDPSVVAGAVETDISKYAD